MRINTIKKNLKKTLIGKGLNNFFDEISLTISDTSPIYDKFIAQKSQYIESKNSNIKGVISESTKQEKFAKITSSCIHLINNLNESDLPTNLNPKLGFYNQENSDFFAFKPTYNHKFQAFQIGFEPNLSINLLKNIADFLISKRNKKTGLWVDGNENDQFNLIHTNTSILYFLTQLGLKLTHELCKQPINYLDSINEISIDTRAKWYFDIQMHRISKVNANRFIDLLMEYQYDENSIMPTGAFILFRQGKSKEIDDPTKLPTHYGGLVFHASYITDVMLHLSPKLKQARLKAEKLLFPIKKFLRGMAKNTKKEGFILDQDGEPSPQFTTWYYILCNGLGIELPEDWEENIFEITQMNITNIFQKTLLTMNLALILINYRNNLRKDTKVSIYSFFETYFENLEIYLKQNEGNISNKDLALYGRGILYINLALGNKIIAWNTNLFLPL